VHDTDSQSFLSQFADMPLSIDFQRTRNTASEAGEEHKNRLYKVGEIDMVGACLFSRTKRWEFIYAQAQNFEVHGSYPEHYRNTLRIDSAYWTTDLCEVLSSFIR